MSRDFSAEYFTTVYSTKCQVENTFLTSKEGLQFICRAIGLVALPVQVFTGYCILKKSPECMKQVKFGLWILNVWYAISQLIYSFIITPYNYFPYLAGFSVGLATNLGIPTPVQYYSMYLVSAAVHVSMLFLFENRSSSIARNRFRIKKTSTRACLLALSYISDMLPLTPIFLNLPEQNRARRIVLESHPCPTKGFFLEPAFVFAAEGFFETYMLMARRSIYFFRTLKILFFSSCSIYYLFISKSSRVSAQTRQLQIRSFVGIVIQFCIPTIFIIAPLILLLQKDKNNDNFKSNKRN